jgi:hypothetical protein
MGDPISVWLSRIYIVCKKNMNTWDWDRMKGTLQLSFRFFSENFGFVQ